MEPGFLRGGVLRVLRLRQTDGSRSRLHELTLVWTPPSPSTPSG